MLLETLQSAREETEKKEKKEKEKVRKLTDKETMRLNWQTLMTTKTMAAAVMTNQLPSFRLFE